MMTILVCLLSSYLSRNGQPKKSARKDLVSMSSSLTDLPVDQVELSGMIRFFLLIRSLQNQLLK